MDYFKVDTMKIGIKRYYNIILTKDYNVGDDLFQILFNIVSSRHTSSVPLAIYSVLALLRMAIVALLILGFPQLESHDGWYFHHGGDQNYYFDYGLVLAEGTFEQYFSVNLGLPAIMALIIRLFGS